MANSDSARNLHSFGLEIFIKPRYPKRSSHRINYALESDNEEDRADTEPDSPESEPEAKRHILELKEDSSEPELTIEVDCLQIPTPPDCVTIPRPADLGDVRKTTKMAPLKDAKRKATEEPGTPSDHKRIKRSESEQVSLPKGHVLKPIPFPKKVSLPFATFRVEDDSSIALEHILI